METAKTSFTGSLRIAKHGHGKATGYWTGVTATEAQTFTYTIGITSDDETSTKNENITKIKDAMDWGINGKVTLGTYGEVEAGLSGVATATVGASAEVEIGGDYNIEETEETEVAFMKDVSQLSGSNSNMERTTTCTPMVYDDAGILMTGSDAPLGSGLWLWVITTEDHSVSAMTPHTVCRYGENAYRPPKCPFWECLNADCT